MPLRKSCLGLRVLQCSRPSRHFSFHAVRMSVVIITVPLNMSMTMMIMIMILQSSRMSQSSGQLSGIVFRSFLIKILARKPGSLTRFVVFLISSAPIPRLWPLPSTSFPIYYVCIESCYIISLELLIASLNNS